MEPSNIIETSTGIIILNGGDPINDCPKDWKEAERIEEKLNESKDSDVLQPLWKFDCGYKLDFDGPIVNISSRFYPPKTDYGPTWDGTVTISIFDKEIVEKKFDCKTLEELRAEVEKYIEEFKNKLLTFIFPP